MVSRVQPISPRLPGKRSAWKALENHYRKIRGQHLRELFAEDSHRGERLTALGAGLYLDYSKNRITEQTIRLLVQLADESGLQSRIDAMFRGERVNITENRPALHVALRAPRGASIFVDGENVVPQVHAMLDKMARFCNSVRRGDWKGSTGRPIRNIINIGSGGSHIGPLMAYEALKHFSDRSLNFRFLSNLDGTDFVEAIRGLDASETLFIICSKSFTTVDTLTNVSSVRSWLIHELGGEDKVVAKHCVVISQNSDEAAKFDLDPGAVFSVWNWVGDPYSIDAAVGLSTMLAIGPENFFSMLDGFHQMDMHFLTTPFERNLPVLIGLLTVWYANLFGVDTVAVLPYEHYLQHFPAYLQQLTMESNGKHVTLIGTEVTQATSPLYWGAACSTAQHAFDQLFHQGTRLVPADFITFGNSLNPVGCHHDLLVASVFAQTEALAFGKTPESVRADGSPDWLVPHRVFEGNRPSNTILGERLTPETLGKLIALYEHSVFTQGVIWNINSFDQWGKELSGALAQRIAAELTSAENPNLEHDSSTNTLIRRYRKLKGVA